jgi:high-affinity nickel-transport protein
VLNAVVLKGIIDSWRDLRRGRLAEKQLELQLLNPGLVNRILGGRAGTLIRSSWHMYPLGILFGLGLETASEVTLLTLSASTAQAGQMGLLATLSLPLLFAAGMSAFDTCDGLLMSLAYTWSQRRPARRLHYNIVTTWATVFVAGFISSVYLAAVLVEHAGVAFPFGVRRPCRSLRAARLRHRRLLRRRLGRGGGTVAFRRLRPALWQPGVGRR